MVDPYDAGLDPATRELFAQLGQSPSVESGTIHNVIRAMANHPGLLAGLLGGLGSSVYGPDAHITPSQRELAYLTASVGNRCHY